MELNRNWDGIVRRHLPITTRGVNTGSRSVDVIASTTAIDAHGDILEQDWRLERYLRNPVVLWNHNVFESSAWSMGEGARPEDLLPIGRAENVRVTGTGLEATLVFASPDASPLAERVWRLMSEKVLSAVSVGFRPGKVTEEKVDGGTLFRLSDNELMEISVVPIPSNPEAVAKHIAWEHRQLHELVSRDAPQRLPESLRSASGSADLVKAVNEAVKQRAGGFDFGAEFDRLYPVSSRAEERSLPPRRGGSAELVDAINRALEPDEVA